MCSTTSPNGNSRNSRSSIVASAQRSEFAPSAVKTLKREGALVIQADLTGVDPQADVTITVRRGVLSIWGERGHGERKQGQGQRTRYDRFQWSIPLPEDTRVEEIQATYRHGMVQIVAPVGAGEPSDGTRHLERPCRSGRPNRWVLLDSAWAKRLGVSRIGGLYRIRSQDLVSRLSDLRQPSGLSQRRITLTSRKGTRVVVVGRLTQRSWEAADGSRRSAVEVQVDDMGPSLRYGSVNGEEQ